MTKLPATDSTLPEEQRRLTRWRWGLRTIALAAVGLWGAYYLLVVQTPLQAILPDVLLAALLVLGLVEACFRGIRSREAPKALNHTRLSAHAERLQQFQAISQSLMASPALSEAVLSTALESLIEIHDAQRGSLWLLGDAGQTQRFIVVGVPAHGRPEKVGDETAWRTKTFTGSGDDPWISSLLPGARDVRSFVAVPILAGERVWGYLTLADRAHDEPFDAQDQFLLEVFATNLGVILENGRLLARAQRQADQMATLYEVGLATTLSLDIDAVLFNIYEQCRRALEVDIFYGAFYRPEEEKVTYVIFYDQGQRVEPFRASPDVGLAGQILETQRHLRRDEAPVPAEALPAEAYRPGDRAGRSYLGVPLVRRQETIGVLAIQSYRAQAYGDADVQLLTMLAVQAAIAIENALLFQETRQKLAEAALLSEVSHAITAKLTEEDLLPHLARNVARVLDCDGCFIALHGQPTVELELAAVYGPGAEAYRRLGLDGDGFSLPQAVMASRQPLPVNDVSSSPYVDQETARQLPDRSLLGLPLTMQDRVVGVAVVGESRQRRRFTEREIQRAMVVANQVAVAIANARLFREVERRLVELGTLAEISRVISSLMQPADIYQKVVDELARAFGYPFLAFYRREGQGLELGAQLGYSEGQLPVYVPWGYGLVGEVASTGQTSYNPDLGSVSEHRSRAPGVVSQIAMPVRKDERVLGVLTVESFETLTEADLSLLQSLSYQISTAIENDRLYAAEQREREVARTLLQIAGDLSGTLDLDEVLDLILERLRAVLPYESAAIGLLSGDACYLAAADEWHRAEQLWGRRLTPKDLPLVGQVIGERKAVLVADTRRLDDWVVIEGSEHIRSWLGVPLVVKDRTIGLLMLNHTAPGFYDEEASGLALAFAQHAALAIENAQLYEQTQAKLREQTLLYEMTTAVSSTLDAGQVLRLLAKRLVTVLGISGARIATLQASPDDGSIGGGAQRLLTAQTAAVVAEHSRAEAPSKLGEVYNLADLPVTARALQDRRPLPITANDGPAEWRAVMTRRSEQAMLLLPLVARDRVTGFVELWESRSRRRFTEAEVALAQTLINQAAVAIDNARLFAETQRRLNELTLLYDVAVAAASTRDLDAILQGLVKTLQFRVLEGAVVSVSLLDASQGQLQLHAHAGQLDGVTLEALLAQTADLREEVIETGQFLLVSDTRQDPRCPDCDAAVRSILYVPLTWGRGVVGLLQAFSAQPHAFSRHDRRLLRTMAGSLAVAIENVRLFTQLEHSEKALMLRNQALERANDRLQELDRLKSSFIASVSHELRTPLNSIIGFSEVLIDGLAGELTAMAHEYLGYIHSSGHHLLDLINDILDLSKIQAGRMTLNLEQVDVTTVIEEVRATLAPLVTKKKQRLSVQVEDSLPGIVADPLRLKQMLLNLMSNAQKFTQEEGEITVRAFMADPHTLQLDVTDNGPGIPLEDQGLIFEEFRQARASRPPGEGTGLGLSITKRLAELHGGHIWVNSQLGEGSTFTILLPALGPEPVPEGEKDDVAN